MKIAALLVVALVLAALAALGYLGFQSQSGRAPGLVDGRLSKCPGSPNCVCSEYEADSEHYIEALELHPGGGVEAMRRLKGLIGQMGGEIQVESEDYIAAIFRSSIFRFVDDLEIRLDREQGLVQLRSASRVGRGDGGVNRQRIERLKNLFRSPDGG